MTTVLCALYLTLGWAARGLWERSQACAELAAITEAKQGGRR